MYAECGSDGGWHERQLGCRREWEQKRQRFEHEVRLDERHSANGSSAEPAATSGVKTGSPPSGYRLDADESKLTPHVGHKVEISGTIENPGSTSAAADDVFSSAPRLKVVSIRTLAASCDQ